MTESEAPRMESGDGQLQPIELERYLHEHIPLSSAMGTRVLAVDENGVVLSAPLAPNINHRDSVFGGSESALAILAAWSLVHARLQAAGLSPRIVIQRNAIEYEAPILGDFTARSFLTEPAQWERFVRSLRSRGRARIRVGAVLEADGVQAATFAGDFVAISVGGSRMKIRAEESRDLDAIRDVNVQAFLPVLPR